MCLGPTCPLMLSRRASAVSKHAEGTARWPYRSLPKPPVPRRRPPARCRGACRRGWPGGVRGPGRGHGVQPEGANEGSRLPMAVGHRRPATTAARGPTAASRHPGRGTGLVDEDKSFSPSCRTSSRSGQVRRSSSTDTASNPCSRQPSRLTSSAERRSPPYPFGCHLIAAPPGGMPRSRQHRRCCPDASGRGRGVPS